MGTDKAERFASSLDREDYSTAADLLDDLCVYYIDGNCITGKDRVVSALREGDVRARKFFDRTIYSHSVEEIGPQEFLVVYIDSIRQRGRAFVHKCKQKIAFNKFEKIDLIIHHHIPGEEEKLKTYMGEME